MDESTADSSPLRTSDDDQLHYEPAPSTSCTAPQRQGPQCRPSPGPLEEQGVSHHPPSEAHPGAQWPLLQGGACLLPGTRPTNPRGAARLYSARVAIMRTSGGWQHLGVVPYAGAWRPSTSSREVARADQGDRPGPSGLQHPPLLPHGCGMRPGGGGPRPGTWRGTAEGRAPGAAQGSEETCVGTAWPVRSA